MKKIILSIVAALVCVFTANAIPAWPGKIVHVQPDGSTIDLYQHGDEWGHWLTDGQGRIVRKDPDGFFRVAADVSVETVKATARMRRAARQASWEPDTEHIALGKKRFLVVLVEFSNLSFSSSDPQADFHNLMNQPGYSVNGATGSARDYYYDNSHGIFEPIFDVFGPVKLPKGYEYYGENDRQGWDLHPDEALIEACKALDPTVDFSQYDNDGDGKVDLVFMYYAGYGENEVSDTNTIWPHQGSLRGDFGKSVNLDGKRIDSYACTCELISYGAYKDGICGIGAACHEFAHAMGLPDFYDTDYEDNGEAGGLYAFSLMCSGCYNNDARTPPFFNIIERIMLGWITEDAILTFNKPGSYIIPPVTDNVAYMTPSDIAGEYFVYECRVAQGWDAPLKAEGLIVYHVDQSNRTVKGADMSAFVLWKYWFYYNSINAYGKHPCFYVVPAADQKNLLYYGGIDRMVFPGYNKVTSYVAKSWNGVSSDYKISNIAYGSGVLSLDVDCPEVQLGYAMISNPGNGVYAAGSSFKLEIEDRAYEPAKRIQWMLDGAIVPAGSVVLTAGRHTIDAVIFTTADHTYTVSLDIEAR